jgi:hypothetical protein
MKSEQIKSIHIQNGKKVIYLKEKDIKYKAKKNKIKAKNYFKKIKNSK